MRKLTDLDRKLLEKSMEVVNICHEGLRPGTWFRARIDVDDRVVVGTCGAIRKTVLIIVWPDNNAKQEQVDGVAKLLSEFGYRIKEGRPSQKELAAL